MNTHSLILQPVFNPEVEKYLQGLLEGSITATSFHSKKCYAKRSNNIINLLNLTVAWELYKYGQRK